MRSVASPYDGEIAFVDQQLGRLLRAGEVDKAVPTLVLVTADHGESLGEHGEDTSFFVYDSTIAYLHPGRAWRAGGVVAQTVAQWHDVAPRSSTTRA
jgi:arylsulfatase A-like enzyme